MLSPVRSKEAILLDVLLVLVIGELVEICVVLVLFIYFVEGLRQLLLDACLIDVWLYNPSFGNCQLRIKEMDIEEVVEKIIKDFIDHLFIFGQ